MGFEKDYSKVCESDFDKMSSRVFKEVKFKDGTKLKEGKLRKELGKVARGSRSISYVDNWLKKKGVGGNQFGVRNKNISEVKKFLDNKNKK